MTRASARHGPRVGVDDGRRIADSVGVKRTRAPLLVLLAAAPVACLGLNPAFDGNADDAGASAASGASAAETSAAPTGSTTATATASTGAPGSTSDASTSGVQATTSDGSSAAATTTMQSPDMGAGSTSSGSTGDVISGMFELPAVVGACVFVGIGGAPEHGGPGECSLDADTINDTALTGLMMVDVEVKNMAGKMRPARPYLRFDIPDKYAGATVTAATLYVQVADGVTMLPQSGELWLTEPFAAADLDVKAPTLTQLLVPDHGEVQPDQWIAWVLPPALVEPGESLYLALQPTHDKGVMLRGASTEPGAPYLEVTLQ